MRVDRIWTGARIATLDPGRPGLGVIEDGAVAAREGRIAWVGPAAEMPALDAAERIDVAGRWITPGLVDCHTHLVYGGDRAHEFELRLQGASYEEIARAGGGIVSTVKATRVASRGSARRLGAAPPRRADRRRRHHHRDQVGLRARHGDGGAPAPGGARAGHASARSPSSPRSSARMRSRPRPRATRTPISARVCNDMLPAIAREGLADAVDAFMEGIAFDAAQTARVFETARALGLPVKLHADQLSNLSGAALAARYAALSADHLEFTDEAGAAAMAASGTVAVLLPGAFYFIRETQRPPVDLFRKHGVGIAIATDCNPGIVAGDVAAAGHEHGRDPVPPHRR